MKRDLRFPIVLLFSFMAGTAGPALVTAAGVGAVASIWQPAGWTLLALSWILLAYSPRTGRLG